MKSIKFLFNVALISTCVLWFSSCDDEGEVAIVDPTANLTGTDIDQAVFEPGETIDLTLEFITPQGIAGVNWEFFDTNTNTAVGTKEFNNPDSDPDLASITSADTQGSVNLSIPVPEAAAEGQFLTLVVEVLDKSSANGATAQFAFTVQSAVNSFQTVLLQAPTGDKASETFFSTNTGERFTVNEVNTGAAGTSATIDFGYYYGATNAASLASPSAYPSAIYDLSAEGWNTLNATTFRSTTLTQSQFNETTTLSQIQAAFDNGTDPGGQKTGLSVGDVLAFQTDATKTGGSKVGLILVSALNPGTESDKSITLDIIVQE